VTEPTPLDLPDTDGQLIGVEGAAISHIQTLARQGLEPKLLQPGGYYMVATANGEIQEIDLTGPAWSPAPKRITGTTTVHSVDSWLELWGKYANEHSEVYTTTGGDGMLTLTGVVDADNPDADRPGWRSHRIVLKLQRGAELDRWMAFEGRLHSQAAFVDFLELRRRAVIEPDSASLLELCRHFSVSQKAAFETTYDQRSGRKGLKYMPDDTAKAGPRGDIPIPERLVIRAEVFAHTGDFSAIEFLFRYQAGQVGLSLGLVFDSPQVVDEATETVLEAVHNNISQRVLVGTAPAPAAGA